MLGLLPAGARAPDLEHRAFREGPLAGIRYDAEKSEQHARLIVLGDEGAATLLPNNEIFRSQGRECLAHRALTDADLGGKFHLARQRLPRPPAAVDETLHERIAH